MIELKQVRAVLEWFTLYLSYSLCYAIDMNIATIALQLFSTVEKRFYF